MMANQNSDLRLELDAYRRDQTQTASTMTLPTSGSAS
jgi:hypothetical protein